MRGWLSYIVPKGSIAVNGISLTIADCSPSGDWFAVAVIPVTYRENQPAVSFLPEIG